MTAANLRDLFKIAGRWDDSSQSGSAHWLDNYRGDRAVRLDDRLFDFGGIFLSPIETAVGALVIATITIRSTYAGEFP